MLAYEPLENFEADGVRLLGIEGTRCTGSWPTMRHVFEVGRDAALYVDVDVLGSATVYGVGFNDYGDELLTPI